MSKRLLAGLVVLGSGWLLLGSDMAAASSLRVAPLSFEATLAAGEKKKGFVDFTNPESGNVKVSLRVQAFRQIDDTGRLEFFDSEQVAAGITLDYTEAELGPRETLHLAFLLDGTKLPAGDVFAAIFASAQPPSASGSQQVVRVGSLLSIVNGTPSERKSEIAHLAAPWLQTGQGLQASFAVKNVSDPKKSTGYYPNITVTTWPFGGKEVKGPLVFAGRTRTVDYRQPGNYIGPIRITVRTDTGLKSTYALAVTGFWMWLLPALIVVVAVSWMVFRLTERRRRHSL